MIFRIKRHWWSSLTATAVLFAVAWTLRRTEPLTGQLGSLHVALGVGLGAAAVLLLGNFLIHQVLRLGWGTRYLDAFRAFAVEVIGRMGPLEALAGGLMAALGEEPLFRGVLLPAIGRNAWGVLGSAVVFGAAHYLRPAYWGFFLWGIGEGIAFGTLYVASGTVLVPAIAHGIFDTIGFLYFERLARERA